MADPLGFFKKELEGNDAPQRVEAVSRLRVIALALGPEKARSELLPFLTSFVTQDVNEARRPPPRAGPAPRLQQPRRRGRRPSRATSPLPAAA